MQNVQDVQMLGIPVRMAANSISMSEAFIWRLIGKKIIKTFKFGKSVRIENESWNKYLEGSKRK